MSYLIKAIVLTSKGHTSLKIELEPIEGYFVISSDPLPPLHARPVVVDSFIHLLNKNLKNTRLVLCTCC